MVPWLEEEAPFPATSQALGAQTQAPGLLAAGRELTQSRLEQAYRRGIFPWFSQGQPVLWWSPDPRMVLPVAELRISRSLRRSLRRFMADPRCEIGVDRARSQVIRACAGAAREGQHGTWIVPAMVQAYELWPRVHSVETWIDGELAGGLYGVAVGRMFFGESMFAHRSDASKIALCALVALCRREGITLIDCQQNTAHLASLGAREWSRAAFESHLQLTTALPEVDDWSYHPSHWSTLGLEAATHSDRPPQPASGSAPDPNA